MLATLAPLSLVLIAAEIPDAHTGASAQVAAAASERRRRGQRRRRPAAAPVHRPAEARHPRAEGPGRLARRAAARRRTDRRRPLRRRRGPACAARSRATRGCPRSRASCARSPPRRRAIPSCWRPWRTGRAAAARGWSASSGVGLLQIKASMFAAGARLPFPRADLEREKLLDPAHNLRVGAALLAMWERGARRDRSRGRQHAAPHGGRPLLLGRQGVGRDAGGSHVDRAPPPARGVRERAGRVPALDAGGGDHVAAGRRAAPGHQRPRRRPRRRRALAPRRRHRRHHRRAGARRRRRRRRVRRRRHDGRPPGAGAVAPPPQALAPQDQHDGPGRFLRARHARRTACAAATSISIRSASRRDRRCARARSSAPSAARA